MTITEVSEGCLRKPLDVVQELFRKRFASAADVAAGGDDFGEKAFFQRIFEDPNLATQVPAVGVNDMNHVADGSLVRFRGMVQDMLNPEIFVGAFREPNGEWQTCKYQDVVPPGLTDSAETTVWERRPFYCVPVPAEAAWYIDGVLPAGRMPSKQAEPEPRDKRMRDENDTDVTSLVTGVTDMDVVESGEEAASSLAKQQKQEVARDSAGQVDASMSGIAAGASPSTSLPAASSSTSTSCIVHVYDKDASVLLNDVVEIIGVLSCAPELAQMGFGTEDMDEDVAAAHPPASRVPRIHAIVVRSTSTKGQGQVPATALPAGVLQPAEVMQAREQALRLLSSVVGNDRLAAEYLLLNLLSRVISRQDGVLVGSHSLNITGWPEGPAETGGHGPSEVLFKLLKELAPRAVRLQLDVEAMNQQPLCPRKNYDTNRLDSAPLQLSKGTHCLLDESRLKEGKFLEPGVQNLQALHSVLTAQELEYDFEYYKLPIKTDIPVVIVSGGRSILRDSVDAQIPLNATTAIGDLDSLEAAIAVSDLPLVRRYLACAKHAHFEIPEEMNAVVESAIIAHKTKTDKGGLPPAAGTFHRWITMARLMSGSLGESKLTPSTWAAVMQLEHSREERIRVV